MNITLKATGPMGRFLPAGSSGSLAEIAVAQDATAVDVMRQLGIPEEGSYLVSLNGTALPKAERGERKLAEGDTLAILPPLRGG